MFTLNSPSLSRVLLFLLLPIGTLCTHAKIDREALVQRHNVVTTTVDAEAAVSVGNGDFAFTADITGLQSLPDEYYKNGIPLETLSSWGWHSWPNPKGLALEDTMKAYPFYGREINFPSLQHTEGGAYFRENPHPVPLGRIGFLLDGVSIESEKITSIEQTLDLWSGIILSKWEIEGETVIVKTAVDSNDSILAVDVQSELLKEGRLTIQWAFPLSYNTTVKNKPPLIWDREDEHTTTLEASTPNTWQIHRNTLGADYNVEITAKNASMQLQAPHRIELSADNSSHLVFTSSFSPEQQPPATTPSAVFENSSTAWQDYWNNGGMVQLNKSKDPRALEIERRIILSQYLMRINYSGAIPPAETGLTQLSWYGKHNSEVYIVHASQWYQWGRVQYLEKGLQWYKKILPKGKKVAESQGFEGVRWPKMSGFDGRPTPGTINPFIIWNQPNPIYLCEMVYRAKPTQETLEEYKTIVFESADFLASYAQLDSETGFYNLGPPIKAVTESTGENHTKNPTFELAYWYYTLDLAMQWSERLKLPGNDKWKEVRDGLAPLPVEDGKYLEIESFKGVYSSGKPVANSMVLSYGLLPDTDKMDPEIMRATIHAVTESHPDKLQRWVSWAQGMSAMNYTRLGETDTALSIVANTKGAARFMPSGHVRRSREPNGCITYLPVNASFLSAVALMAEGWDDSEGLAPGFPNDGNWVVEVEGMYKMP